MTALAGQEAASVAASLREVDRGLRGVVVDSGKEVEQLARDFEGLAGDTSGLLEAAGAIMRCAEDEKVTRVLPGAHRLGAAARSFLHERLDATGGILGTVGGEAALLERLAHLTRGQKAIVRETEMLRVLTNIEVARLGEVGAGFQYLAHELDDFSQVVARSTQELTGHTDERRKAIAETRRSLAVELPQMREEFTRIEESLENALGLVDATIEQMRQTPHRFRACLEETAAQIAGVVAAIQGHDITRQEIEHVYEALQWIAADLEGSGGARLGETRAGLAIQSYQLENVRRTVEGWTAQIRTCLEGIARITSSELIDLGHAVLAQESALSAQMSRIEKLEGECEAGNARVQASFAGISGLMELVSEHLERSKSVRDRLQLLMFNSIVEASHLGSQADGILEISTTIKRISSAWAAITTQSETATGEIRALVEHSRATLDVFSRSSNETLREARTETMGGLEILREAAAYAEARGREIQAATLGLQAKIEEIGRTAERVEASFRHLGRALEGIEAARKEVERRGAAGENGGEGYDAAAVTARFSAHYTTEAERAILEAALRGGPLPEVQESFTGNSVELF